MQVPVTAWTPFLRSIRSAQWAHNVQRFHETQSECTVRSHLWCSRGVLTAPGGHISHRNQNAVWWRWHSKKRKWLRCFITVFLVLLLLAKHMKYADIEGQGKTGYSVAPLPFRLFLFIRKQRPECWQSAHNQEVNWGSWGGFEQQVHLAS